MFYVDINNDGNIQLTRLLLFMSFTTYVKTRIFIRIIKFALAARLYTWQFRQFIKRFCKSHQ